MLLSKPLKRFFCSWYYFGLRLFSCHLFAILLTVLIPAEQFVHQQATENSQNFSKKVLLALTALSSLEAPGMVKKERSLFKNCIRFKILNYVWFGIIKLLEQLLQSRSRKEPKLGRSRNVVSAPAPGQTKIVN
jgi:hypothetical protein